MMIQITQLHLNNWLSTLLVTKYDVNPVMEIRAHIFTFKGFSVDVNEFFRQTRCPWRESNIAYRFPIPLDTKMT